MQHRLSIKVLIPIGLILFTFLLSWWSLQVNIRASLYRNEHQSLNELNRDMTRLQAEIENAIRLSDHSLIQEQIAEFSAVPQCVDAVLFDQNDVVIASANRAYIGQSMQAVFAREDPKWRELCFQRMAEAKARHAGSVEITPDRQSLMGVYPIHFVNTGARLRAKVIGILYMHNDLTALKHAVVRSVKQQTLTITIGLCVFAVGLGFFFHLFFARRIGILIDATRRISEGDLTTITPVGVDDEISVLTQALNDMMIRRRDAEARNDAILNTALDAIITIDEQGIIESFNPGAERIFGYSKEEIVGKDIAVLLHRSDKNKHNLNVHDYIRANQPYKIGIGREIKGLHKNGEILDLHLALSELHLNDRRIFTGIIRDISDLKSVQRELHNREVRYRSILEAANDSIITIDHRGTIEMINPATKKMFGYTLAEIQGQNVSVLMPSPYKERHDDYVNRYLKSGKKHVVGTLREALGRKKDGTIFPIEISLSEGFVGESHFFTGILRDITHKKEFEQALQESRRRLELALESAELGSWDWDIKTGRLYYDQRWLDMLGYDKSDVEFHIRSREKLIHPDDIKNACHAMDCHLKGLTPFYKSEHRMLSKSGDWVWVRVQAKIVEYGKQGEPLRMAGTHRDITAQKMAEQAIEMARRQEIEIGWEIQRSLLLGKPPSQMDGIQLGALAVPAREICGDFYDFIRYSDQILDLIIGDVMGKGIVSALLGAATKSQLLRSCTILGQQLSPGQIPLPSRILDLLLKRIANDLISLETFITLCYCRFDLIQQQALLVDCGHTRTIHYQKSVDACCFISGENCPLGFVTQDAFKEITVPFREEDVFLFYSDGVTECQNRHGELFGEQRLADLVHVYHNHSPQQLLETISSQLREFCGELAFSDDFTCVVVKIGHRYPIERIKGIRATFHSRTSELSSIRRFITDQCSVPPHAMDPARIDELLLAVQETVVNVIKHAYHNDPGKQIDIQVQHVEDGALITIEHSGDLFKHELVPEPVFDGSKESGFGLFIVKNSVDSVHYDIDESGQSFVRLFKCYK